MAQQEVARLKADLQKAQIIIKQLKDAEDANIRKIGSQDEQIKSLKKENTDLREQVRDLKNRGREESKGAAAPKKEEEDLDELRAL